MAEALWLVRWNCGHSDTDGRPKPCTRLGCPPAYHRHELLVDHPCPSCQPPSRER